MILLKELWIFRLLNRMKVWVESYSGKPNARFALWFFALIEAVFFPIPPDVLLIAMAFSVPSRSWNFAWVCTFGSITGAVIGYGVGFFMSDIGKAIINFFDTSKNAVDEIQRLFDLYGFWGIIIAAITPIPFKVFTVASGLFKYDFITFMGAVAVGRPIRFFAVGALFFFFGKKIKPFIDKHFEWLSIVFVVLLVGGFVFLKYIRPVA
ncbi:MAG: DedA family protein [Bacteroidetes bacterium]|nr:DedA family protein [Bacteroidota bacterium]